MDDYSDILSARGRISSELYCPQLEISIRFRYPGWITRHFNQSLVYMWLLHSLWYVRIPNWLAFWHEYSATTIFLLDDTLWLHDDTLVITWRYTRLGLGFLVTIVAVMSLNLCEEVVLGRLFPVVVEVSSSRLLACPTRTNSVALCSRGSRLPTGPVFPLFTSLSLFRFSSKMALLIYITWGLVHCSPKALGCLCPSGDSLDPFVDCIFFPSPFVSLPLVMG